MLFSRKKLSETEFSNKFAKALQKKLKGLAILHINGLEVISKLPESEEHRHFLDNAYIEYSRDIRKLKEVINKYVIASSDSFEPEKTVSLESILPVVKNKRFIKNLEGLNFQAASQQVHESYNTELDIFYVIDTEHSIRYLTKADLDKLDLSPEELKVISMQNLDQLEVKCHGEDGYYMLTAGGTYESSSILLDIWYKDNFAVEGDIIIAIPSRDVVLVTGSKDSANLHKMYDAVKEISETGNYLVSDKLFELKGDRFEVMR